ncbi:MAG: purine-nucleoside phosphorylase [Armatimonadota bacterium]|nr:purine-nucleoside phosphorylase [Armatimonadota bacterium]
MSWAARAREAAAVIGQRIRQRPEVAIVLGSGLGALADLVEAEAVLPYDQIPHFVPPRAPGHAGRLVVGRLEGRTVAVLQGRVHAYEGVAMAEVVFPVRALRALGAHTLLVTNAAGGLHPALAPGDLLLITDHINAMGTNPLVGPNEDAFGPRFPDMAAAYDPALLAAMRAAAAEAGIALRDGIYLAVLGPSYETPAEVRMMRGWGADAVGMSTVPEVIAARHAGMRVVGLSVIANVAAGTAPTGPAHEDVLAVVARAVPRCAALVRGFLRRLPG